MRPGDDYMVLAHCSAPAMSWGVDLEMLSLQQDLLKQINSSEATDISKSISAVLTRLQPSKDNPGKFADGCSRDDIGTLYSAHNTIWYSYRKKAKVWPFVHVETRKKLKDNEVKGFLAPEFAVQESSTNYKMHIPQEHIKSDTTVTEKSHSRRVENPPCTPESSVPKLKLRLRRPSERSERHFTPAVCPATQQFSSPGSDGLTNSSQERATYSNMPSELGVIYKQGMPLILNSAEGYANGTIEIDTISHREKEHATGQEDQQQVSLNMPSSLLDPNTTTSRDSHLGTLDQDETAEPPPIAETRKRRRTASPYPKSPEQRRETTSSIVHANTLTTSNNSRRGPSPAHMQSEADEKNKSYLDNEHERGCIKKNALPSEAHQDVPELPQPQTQHELHEAANNLNHRTISNDLDTSTSEAIVDETSKHDSHGPLTLCMRVTYDSDVKNYKLPHHYIKDCSMRLLNSYARYVIEKGQKLSFAEFVELTRIKYHRLEVTLKRKDKSDELLEGNPNDLLTFLAYVQVGTVMVKVPLKHDDIEDFRMRLLESFRDVDQHWSNDSEGPFS